MKYFRYTLSHSVVGSLVLTYAPQEWASDSAFWERSMTYWGVFRSFSTKELSIIKNGATWLKSVFDTYGTEAEVSYKVETFNPSTYSYDTTYTGILDFSTYRYEDRGRYDVVKIQVIDDTFTNTVKTRESLSVNLAKLYDLDGNAITPFTNEGVTVNVPTRVDYYTASYAGAVLNQALVSHVPMITYSARDESSAVRPTDTNAIAAIEGAFLAPTFATEVYVQVQMTGSIHLVGTEDIYCLIRHYNSSGVLQAGTTLFSKSGTGSPEDYTINVDDDHTFYSVADGDYTILLLSVANNDPSTLISYVISMDISYSRTVLSTFDFVGYPYYEAFTRILQAITGDANPFYSALLGRTDSEISDYASDGDLSLGVVTNGLLVRGFSLSDTDVSLSVSLKSLFSSLAAIRPICLGIESMSSVKKVRIEDLTYAFDSHYFLTIENCSNIVEEVAIDLTYSALSIGFTKHEETWNEAKGRYEYNTVSKYSTALKRHQNEFTQQAPYRADGNVIVYARQSAAITEAAGENTPYDNDIILLSIHRDGSDLKVKEDEGYTSVGNVDNPAQSYNLDYAPARSLKRWGAFLRGCLEKYTASILSFLRSDKNATMYSQLTTESAPVYEGADINVSDLDDPFFENIYYSFDCVVSSAMIALLNGVTTAGKPLPYLIVRFRGNTSESYKYGWIMKVEARKEDNKGMGTIKLLKVNTTYVTPAASGTTYTADSTTVTVDSTTVTSDIG